MPISTSSSGPSLRKKNIKLVVVKNSLARRATEGTPLAPAFEGVEGHAGHGLGRRRYRLAGQRSRAAREAKDFEGFAARGGVMDGAKLSAGGSQGNQQMAQPGGAIVHAGRSDPGAGCQGCLAAVGHGRRAGQPDQEAAQKIWRRPEVRKPPAEAPAEAPAAT